MRALLSALLENGMLTEFDTTVASDPSASWVNLLPRGLKREWLRRSYPIPQNYIVSYPAKELIRMLLPRLGFKSVARHEYG